MKKSFIFSLDVALSETLSLAATRASTSRSAVVERALREFLDRNDVSAAPSPAASLDFTNLVEKSSSGRALYFRDIALAYERVHNLAGDRGRRMAFNRALTEYLQERGHEVLTTASGAQYVRGCSLAARYRGDDGAIDFSEIFEKGEFGTASYAKELPLPVVYAVYCRMQDHPISRNAFYVKLRMYALAHGIDIRRSNSHAPWLCGVTLKPQYEYALVEDTIRRSELAELREQRREEASDEIRRIVSESREVEVDDGLDF